MAEHETRAHEGDEAAAVAEEKGDSSTGKDESTPQAQLQEEPASETDADDEQSEAEKAREAQERHEQAQEKMKELEEDPPEKLEDWPTDEAKYTTFGGSEGDHSYEEGPERKLGPSEVRYHEDGTVTVEGEEVENPDDFKGDPIPGGPTDPNAPKLSGERDESEKSSEESESD